MKKKKLNNAGLSDRVKRFTTFSRFFERVELKKVRINRQLKSLLKMDFFLIPLREIQSSLVVLVVDLQYLILIQQIN